MNQDAQRIILETIVNGKSLIELRSDGSVTFRSKAKPVLAELNDVSQIRFAHPERLSEELSEMGVTNNLIRSPKDPKVQLLEMSANDMLAACERLGADATHLKKNVAMLQVGKKLGETAVMSYLRDQVDETVDLEMVRILGMFDRATLPDDRNPQRLN